MASAAHLHVELAAMPWRHDWASQAPSRSAIDEWRESWSATERAARGWSMAPSGGFRRAASLSPGVAFLDGGNSRVIIGAGQLLAFCLYPVLSWKVAC